MLEPKRHGGAVADDGSGEIASSAMEVPEPEMRFGRARCQRDRFLPGGKSRRGFGRFHAHPKNVPRIGVGGVERDGATRTRGSAFERTISELGAREVSMKIHA